MDFRLPSKWYRRVVGGSEILCGLLLMTVPSRRVKNVANVLLLFVKLLNCYSHWAINDEFERTAPTLVFLLMLGCRMVVDWQVGKREAEEARANAAYLAKKGVSTSSTSSIDREETKKVQ